MMEWRICVKYVSEAMETMRQLRGAGCWVGGKELRACLSIEENI